MSHAKDNSCFVIYLVISPEQIFKPNTCAIHNFFMVCNILTIFNRDKDKDHKRCHVQERQFSFSSLCTNLP